MSRSHINTRVLIAARKSNHLTQTQVASRIGVTRSQFANIELGNTDPSVETLINIAIALGLSLDVLCDWSGATVQWQTPSDPLPFDSTC